MGQDEQQLKEWLEFIKKSEILSWYWKALPIVATLLAIYKLGEACGEFYYFITH